MASVQLTNTLDRQRFFEPSNIGGVDCPQQAIIPLVPNFQYTGGGDTIV